MSKATSADVAAYILKERGPITAMKLQKLLYYSQAWYLVWEEEPLFDEEIEAWANGPVVPEIYHLHAGQFRVRSLIEGDSDNLTEDQCDAIDEVLDFYGDRSSQWLSDLTHREDPWRRARKGIPDGERSSRVISHASMAEYYGSL